MNMEIFKLINNLGAKNIVFDNIMMFFSKYVPLIFMGLVAGTFILGMVKQRKEKSIGK